jgi:hypothetical protein
MDVKISSTGDFVFSTDLGASGASGTTSLVTGGLYRPNGDKHVSEAEQLQFSIKCDRSFH